MIVLTVLPELVLVEFVLLGGGLLPPGPSANAGEASRANVPERTSNRREFFIGRGILSCATVRFPEGNADWMRQSRDSREIC